MNMDGYSAQKFLSSLDTWINQNQSFIAQCKVANIAPAPGPYTQHCIQFEILEDLTSWKNIWRAFHNCWRVPGSTLSFLGN